jgi:hypothetical protein
MRDAQLLRHAIDEYSTGKGRDELLISRVVRFHWEPAHFDRVKFEYKNKYGRDAYVDVAKNVKGDYREYIVQMMRTRAY